MGHQIQLLIVSSSTKFTILKYCDGAVIWNLNRSSHMCISGSQYLHLPTKLHIPESNLTSDTRFFGMMWHASLFLELQYVADHKWTATWSLRNTYWKKRKMDKTMKMAPTWQIYWHKLSGWRRRAFSGNELETKNRPRCTPLIPHGFLLLLLLPGTSWTWYMIAG